MKEQEACTLIRNIWRRQVGMVSSITPIDVPYLIESLRRELAEYTQFRQDLKRSHAWLQELRDEYRLAMAIHKAYPNAGNGYQFDGGVLIPAPIPKRDRYWEESK